MQLARTSAQWMEEDCQSGRLTVIVFIKIHADNKQKILKLGINKTIISLRVVIWN